MSPARIPTPQPISTVALDDPSSVWQDPHAKSFAYFCKRRPVRIDQALLAELKRLAGERGGQNVRLCLHEGPGAAFHDMIILEHPGKYYRPHQHLAKGESYHIIEGAMGVFVFEPDGRVADACRLTPTGTVVYRVDATMHHAVMPLSDPVIYHESKPGPFTGESDSVYPDWAPDGRDQDAAAAYTAALRTALEHATDAR